MKKQVVLLFTFIAVFASANAQVNYWSEVGAISPMLNGNNTINCVTYDNGSGTLYVPYFDYPAQTIALAVWNGSSWTKYSPPTTFDSSLNVQWSNPDCICVGTNGLVYIAGQFSDDSGAFVLQWDVFNTWSKVGTGVNGLNGSGEITSLCFDNYNNYLYARGVTINSTGQPYVAKWNGSSWSPMGPAVPQSNGAITSPTVFTINGNVYTTSWVWYTNPYWNNINVFELIGNAWVPLDTIGTGGAYGGLMPVCVGQGNNIYTIAYAPNSNALCVYVWNGIAWMALGSSTNNLNVNDAVNSICVDAASNIYVAGNFMDAQGYRYVAKWDGSVYSELGINNLALHANNTINGICTDGGGNFYAAGNFTDGNGLAYVAEYSPLPPGRVYVFLGATPANCGNSGSISSSVYYGTLPYTYAWSNGSSSANPIALSAGTYYVTVTDASGLVANGYIDVPGNCNSIISGNVFIDSAGSCIYNGQPVIPNVTLTLSGGSQTLYATTDNLGNYSFAVNDTGNYHLYIQVGNGSLCGNFILCGNSNQTIHVSVLGDSSIGNNFALNPASSGFDLYLHPGWTSASPGFEKDYWIYFANNSPIPFTGITNVTFKYDSNLVFISSDIPYTTYNTTADSITWLVNTFNNTGWNYIGKVRFTVPSTLSLNYQLQSQFWIYPNSGDCDTSNNYLHYTEIVKGSHDPNYKEVFPLDYITDADSVLTYTIHYQNTGSDSTYFIIVKDTLSPYLDPSTVRNLASSDNYSDFNVSGTGILTWTFSPLRLADSITNSSGSKGFIIFTVNKKSGLAPGTSINNSASVYFDYNEPAQTNIVTNSIAVVTSVLEVPGNDAISVKAFPNPFTKATNVVVTGINEKFDFELFDMTGRKLNKIPSIAANQFEVLRDNLASGVYLYRISVKSKQVAHGKLVIE